MTHFCLLLGVLVSSVVCSSDWLAPLIPRLFRPRFADRLPWVGSITRKKAFFKEMGWSDVDYRDENAARPLLSDVQPFVETLERVLRNEKPRFSGLLQKFSGGVFHEAAENPEFFHLGDLALYGKFFDFFTRYLEDYHLFSEFMVPLTDAEIIDRLYKVLILVDVSSYLGNHTQAFESYCSQYTAANHQDPLWESFCAAPTTMLAFRIFPAREFHMIVKPQNYMQFQTFFTLHYTHRWTPQDPQQLQQLLARAREIPIEVSPRLKAHCLGFRLGALCRALIERYETAAALVGPDLRERIIAMRTRHSEIAQQFVHRDPLDRLILGFDIDFGVPESEIYEELQSVNMRVLKIFSLSHLFLRFLSESWPTIERVFTSNQPEVELDAIYGGSLERIIRSVEDICHDHPTQPGCEDVRGLFMRITADQMRQFRDRAVAPGTLARMLLGLPAAEAPVSFNVDGFLNLRRRTNLTEAQERECCVCYSEFCKEGMESSSEEAVTAVAVCEAEHLVCEGCVGRIVLGHARQDEAFITCPLCRKKTRDNGETIVERP